MSVKVITAVFEESQATLGARLVLLTLADYAHDDGSKAFPSQATIAEKARMSDRNVRYAIRELEELGELVQTGKTPAGVNVYKITLPSLGRQNLPVGGQNLPVTPAKSSDDPLVNHHVRSPSSANTSTPSKPTPEENLQRVRELQGSVFGGKQDEAKEVA